MSASLRASTSLTPSPVIANGVPAGLQGRAPWRALSGAPGRRWCTRVQASAIGSDCSGSCRRPAVSQCRSPAVGHAPHRLGVVPEYHLHVNFAEEAKYSRVSRRCGRTRCSRYHQRRRGRRRGCGGIVDRPVAGAQQHSTRQSLAPLSSSPRRPPGRPDPAAHFGGDPIVTQCLCVP
jgi:hypothetical protein